MADVSGSDADEAADEKADDKDDDSHVSGVLRDDNYNNWVKGAEGNVFLQKGLAPFVDREIYNKHAQFLSKLPPCNQGTSGCHCTFKNILPDHNITLCYLPNCICKDKGRRRRTCPNLGYCSTFCQLILNEHRTGDPLWKNSDIKAWSTDHWSIGKCYQTTPTSSNSAQTTDASELLSIIINGKFFQTKVTSPLGRPGDIFLKARNIRRHFLQRVQMSLTNAELQDILDTFIAVLEDSASLLHDQDARLAVKQLKTLRTDQRKITIEEKKKLSELGDEILRKVKRARSESVKYDGPAVQKQIDELTDKLPKTEEKIKASGDGDSNAKGETQGTKQETSDQDKLESILPVEILRMDEGSIELYKKALSEGKEEVHNIRVMVVGHYGVGKTTLTKRLLGDEVVIGKSESTDGIEVHVGKCKIDLHTRRWTVVNEDETKNTGNQRLANVLKQTLIDGQEPSKGLQPSVEKQECELEPGMKMVQEKIQDVVVPMPEEVLTENEDVSSSESMPSTSGVQDSKLKNRDEDASEDRLRKDLQKLVNETTELSTDDTSRSTADLSIWDFAGQYAFYATHQVFLSKRAVYLLVTDISKHVNDVVHDDGCYIGSKGLVEWKISEYVNFWLNTIHEFCTSEYKKGPPVILVGTFVDKLEEENRQDAVDDFFKNLRRLLVDKDIFEHIAYDDFHIDNTKTETELEPLRAKILEIAKAQDYWGELIPAKWITLENKLLQLKEKGLKVIEKNEVDKQNSELAVPITSPEEIELFLNFHHESGNLIYFCKDEDLNKMIVLDPQWLIDAFKCLITAKTTSFKQSEILNMWIEFENSAILRKKLIDAVWKTESRFKDHVPTLLLYLEKLGLLAKPCRPSVDKGHQVVDYYFAPSVLKEKPPLEIQTCFTDNGVSSSKLCFMTPSRFVPTAVFNKLMAVCIEQFTLAKQNVKGMIYCGCGVFSLMNNHRLHILFFDSIIKVWIIRYSTSREHPEEELCHVIKEFIQEFLKKELSNVQSYVYVICPRGNEKEYPLEELVQLEEVLCECHSDPHPLETKQFTKYWCSDKRSQDREERETRQASGNFVDTRNYNGLMIPMKEIHCTKEAGECVCLIVFPFKGNQGSGTGFRVGEGKIMTAAHVVEMIKQGSIMTGIKKATDQYAYLTAEGVEAIFGYYDSNSNTTRRFKFKPTVHFLDDKLDVAVLELDGSENATFPNAFLKFSRPLNIPFKLIGHPKSESMIVDNDKSALDLKKEMEKIKYAKIFSKELAKIEFDSPPYNTVDDHRKVLFHCKFSHGASGSPGVCIDAGGSVYVVTMLLCGYPLWLYDTAVEESKKNSWPEKLTIEQGVNMESVYEEMKKTCPQLSDEIFLASN